MMEKLKSWLADDQVFYITLVLLVGIVSFWLGQQSVGREGAVSAQVSNNQANLIEVRTSDPVVEADDKAMEAVGSAVIASKSGTKYHLPNCPGASQIKPENQIRFASIEAARAAGYTPAANCPGLK